MKGTYQGSGGKSGSYSKRGNVGVSSGGKNGNHGGDMFFKNRTMKNTEGVGKHSTIQRRQPS